MRAIVLGGTGAIGGATAVRLAERGWQVDVTGRDPAKMPGSLRSAGVRFHSIDRSDTRAIERLVGDGAELLVDLLAYRGSDVRDLVPSMASVASPVLISSRAVYVDSNGRHINGDEPPRFPLPMGESTPTLPPAGDDVDPFTREGYAPSKVAAELVALDSGLPVTVVRPSKVHGRWSRNARTRALVESMLQGASTIPLAAADSIDHLTAAANTAALIESVAARPSARILNSADPDAPPAEEIVMAIGARLGWRGRLDLLPQGSSPAAGRHPWQAAHPIVLDTRASLQLGYQPVGSALQLLDEEIDWVRASQAPGERQP